MVELAHRIGYGRQCIQVSLQGPHPLLVPGLPARGSKGVDMSDGQILLPGHFVAEDSHEGFIRHGLCSRLTGGPFPADGSAVHSCSTLVSIVKGIAVIGHREKVQIVHLAGIGKGLFHRAGTVGNIRMGMEQAKIEIPVAVEGLFRFLVFR